MCACVHSAHLFVDACEGQGRGSDPLMLDLQVVVICLIGMLEPNSGPLHEQQSSLNC